MSRSLRDLEATFVRMGDQPGSMRRGVDFGIAHGLFFLCPACFEKNGGNVGTHWILCWFNGRGVPDDATPGPGRWNPAGTGIDDLTFVGPGLTSVKLTGGCEWHGYVENGRART